MFVLIMRAMVKIVKPQLHKLSAMSSTVILLAFAPRRWYKMHSCSRVYGCQTGMDVSVFVRMDGPLWTE